MKKQLILKTVACLVMMLSVAMNAFADSHRYAGSYENGRTFMKSKFYGVIEKMPSNMVGNWIISGRKIKVTPYTKIEEDDGPLRVGAYVEVEGYNDLKTFTATEIEVEN